MPANHRIPHTPEAKAKLRAARLGKPATWKHRPTRMVEGVVQFRCGRCFGYFLRDGFYASKRTLLGINSECKACHSVLAIASRDPALTREAKRRSEAKRRARKAGATGNVSANDWDDVLAILGRRCLCCGSDAKPTQDHVIPLARGGLHHPTNLQPLCRPCNERKQARTIDYRSPAQRDAISAFWAISFTRGSQ